MKINLREYQKEGVDEIRFSYMKGNDNVLFVLPTGGGKTVIFSHIAEQAAQKGNRVCILVHREELVNQSSEALDKIGVKHGIISAGQKMDLSYGVQIASVWTLVRRLHKVPDTFFGLIVVDEAHHAVAGSWKKTIDHFYTAKVLGVTATPERLDGKGLKDYFSDMIVGPDTAWLTANKYLAPAKVYSPPLKVDRKNIKTRAGDFAMEEAEEQLMNGDFMGDAVTHYARHVFPGSAIAFCCTVAHAEAVAEAFRTAGFKAEALAGKIAKEERKETIQKLGTREINVLTSCQIISEGTDVPSVAGALLLRPTKSLSLYLQQVGRCLRPAEGKDHAVVMDHVGNSLVHGLPTQAREWSLEGRKKREKDAAPPLKVCKSCYAVAPISAKICPTCGEPFEVEKKEFIRIDGDLVERFFVVGQTVEYLLRDGRWGKDWRIMGQDNETKTYWINNGQFDQFKVDAVRLRPPLKTAMKNAKSFDDLKKLAKQRGYKEGWAYYVWKQRQIKNAKWV